MRECASAMATQRGARYLTSIVDSRAHTDAVWATLILSADLKRRQTVSYSVLANAVDRVAHWLDNAFQGAPQQVFYYEGPPDIRYVVITLACEKSGHQVVNPGRKLSSSCSSVILRQSSSLLAIRNSLVQG